MSVTTLYDPLRQAAATLRETLRVEAARVLNQPADALLARDGGFEATNGPGTRVSYGALVAGAVIGHAITKANEPKTVVVTQPNYYYQAVPAPPAYPGRD